jgi:asparagine synthase (glutamine-hydrolysing)
VAFRPRRLNHSLFTPEFCLLLDQAEETYRTESRGCRLSFVAFKQVPWHHYGRLAVEQSQLTVRSPFLDNELVALAYRAPRDLATSPAHLLALIADGNRAFDMVGSDRALRYRTRPILTPVTQFSQEFTAKAEYVYDYGMPRWLARTDHLLKRVHLERLFLGRHKFYHFRIWYKKQLKGYLDACCDSSIQTSCYRPGAGKQIIQAHLTGRDNHTLELHKLFSVQLIERLLLRAS